MTTNYVQIQNRTTHFVCARVKETSTDSQSSVSQMGIGHQTQKHSFPIIGVGWGGVGWRGDGGGRH